jgi:hypothetical protein
MVEHHRHHHRHHRHRGHAIRGDARVRHKLPLEGRPWIELETEFAAIEMRPIAPGEEPYVEVVGDEPLPELHITVDESGGDRVVRLRGDGMGLGVGDTGSQARLWEGRFWERLRWKRHFQLQLVFCVPPDVRARLRPAAAYVHIENLVDCELDIHADAGAVVLDDVSGRLQLKTDAGRIEGSGLAGSIGVTTTAGAIQLEIVALDPGRHNIRTKMGAAVIQLARGLPVQIDTRTAMGSSRVAAVSTRGADAILDVEADLGAVRIFEARRGWAPRPQQGHPRGPYRSPAAPEPPSPNVHADIEAILARVADGSLTPAAARDLLRELGWG